MQGQPPALDKDDEAQANAEHPQNQYGQFLPRWRGDHAQCVLQAGA